MTERLRVPMANHFREVDASSEMLPSVVGRRFSIDVAESMLRELSPEAVRHIARKLAESVAHEHEGEIRAAIFAFLHDRKWAEPIIREAIREAVHQVVTSMFAKMPNADVAR